MKAALFGNIGRRTDRLTKKLLTITTVYGRLSVARAEREVCELITADDRFLKAMSAYPVIALDSV